MSFALAPSEIPDVGAAPTAAAAQTIAADLNELWRVADPWGSWAPIVEGVTIGNGAVTGRYHDFSGRAIVDTRIVLGSSSTLTSTVRIGGYDTLVGYFEQGAAAAVGAAYDSSAARWFPLSARVVGTLGLPANAAQIQLQAGGDYVNATTPFTFGEDDVIVVRFTVQLPLHTGMRR